MHRLFQILIEELTTAKAEWETIAAGEKLAGNVVKEAEAKGCAGGINLTIMVLSKFMAEEQEKAAANQAHPMSKDYLREAGKAIEAKLPDNHGFLLLVSEFGEPGDKGRTFYMSSMQRQSAINLLKEFLIKASGEEEWMKHIK